MGIQEIINIDLVSNSDFDLKSRIKITSNPCCLGGGGGGKSSIYVTHR